MLDKISVVKIGRDPIDTLRDDNTKRRSLADALLFFVLPAAVAIALLWRGVRLNTNLSSILATALSIFAALLFNLLLLVYALLKKEETTPAKNSATRKRVLDEVAKNISF